MSDAMPSGIERTWSVADLDWYHDEYGGLAEWLASSQRAEKLMAERRAAREADVEPPRSAAPGVVGGLVQRHRERLSDRLNRNTETQESA